MSDSQSDNSGDGQTDGGGIVRRQIPPDPATSEYDLLEILADIEEVDIETLPPLYNQVEHVVETLFKTPPSADAQMSISFSYAGYRITIDRTGTVQFVPVKDTIERNRQL
ncbi:HalOD1 output domain-containing protein [Haloarcula salinisoli]|nr:HalOD1 output domain-containing protein [Halomicroarcula salinisoli]